MVMCYYSSVNRKPMENILSVGLKSPYVMIQFSSHREKMNGQIAAMIYCFKAKYCQATYPFQKERLHVCTEGGECEIPKDLYLNLLCLEVLHVYC